MTGFHTLAETERAARRRLGGMPLNFASAAALPEAARLVRLRLAPAGERLMRPLSRAFTGEEPFVRAGLDAARVADLTAPRRGIVTHLEANSPARHSGSG